MRSTEDICTSVFAPWTILDEDIGNDEFLGECAALLSTWTSTTADATDSEWMYDPEAFPLLALPPELILKVMRCMPAADRWKARIEESAIFEAGRVSVGKSDFEVFQPEDEIQLKTDELYPVSKWDEAIRAPLKKMARNLHIAELYVQSEGDAWRICPLAREIRSDRLYYEAWDFEDSEMVEETSDDTIAEWIDGRKSLSIYGPIHFRGAVLYSIYSDMESGRSMLQKLEFPGGSGPTPEASREFLRLIGLTRGPHGFEATRSDLEVFEMVDGIEIDDDRCDEVASFYFGDPAKHHLFITIGWSIMIILRKWLFTDQLVDRSDFYSIISRDYWEIEFSIERFDANGVDFEPTFDLSIGDIRNNREEFTKLPVTYRV